MCRFNNAVYNAATGAVAALSEGFFFFNYFKLLNSSYQCDKNQPFPHLSKVGLERAVMLNFMSNEDLLSFLPLVVCVFKPETFKQAHKSSAWFRETDCRTRSNLCMTAGCFHQPYLVFGRFISLRHISILARWILWSIFSDILTWGSRIKFELVKDSRVTINN